MLDFHNVSPFTNEIKLSTLKGEVRGTIFLQSIIWGQNRMENAQRNGCKAAKWKNNYAALAAGTY